MKKLFFASVAAVILSSCSNDITETFKTTSENNNGRTPLTIQTYAAGQTRTLATLDDLQANGFYLLADCFDNGATSPIYSPYFYTPGKDNDPGFWSDAKPGTSSEPTVVYWPTNPAATIRMMAFYTGEELTEEDETPISGTCVTLSDVSETNDLMSAFLPETSLEKNPSGAVTLSFEHILSQVRVLVSNDPTLPDYTAFVRRITIYAPSTIDFDISTKTYYPLHDTETDEPLEIETIGYEYAAPYVSPGYPDGAIKGQKDLDLRADAEDPTFLVVPMEDLVLEIQYALSKDTTMSGDEMIRTATFTPVMGALNTLKVVLSPETVQMTIDVSASEWEEQDPSNVDF
ncbi:MAG: fimbrillin family protein [Bacteroidales bacterium]|nr:fimbrillin family protein [Candidatus Liminaster caballi]